MLGRRRGRRRKRIGIGIGIGIGVLLGELSKPRCDKKAG
jgi:hypothetical protein